MGKYAIPEGNIERLREKIARVQRKCTRYGCTFNYAETGEEFRTVKGADGEQEVQRYITVDASGVAVLNGWRFVATLEHTSTGNVVRSVEGAPEVPARYYTCSPYCEHCKVDRWRKSSFIVQNVSTGEFKQVGKNCLADFTGGMSAETVAQWESLRHLMEESEQPAPGAHVAQYYDVEQVLCYFIECTNKFGYIRRGSSSTSTAQAGADFWLYDHARSRLGKQAYAVGEKMHSVNFTADTAKNREEARQCIEWAVCHEQDESNFMHNLAVICRDQYTKASSFGYLACLPHSRRKALQIEQERAVRSAHEKAHSEHVGKVGDRVLVDVESVDVLASWDTEYGRTYLLKITDKHGNVYTWKTGSPILDGEAKRIKGTVKEHSEYNGVKQTVLTRCRVEE